MKALELIKALERLVDKHGDLPVEVYDSAGDSDDANTVEMRLFFRIDSKITETIFIQP